MRPLSLLLAVSIASLGHAEDLKAIAQRNADAQRKATLAKDISWFEKTQAPDYFEVDEHGKRNTRAASLEGTKQMFKVMKIKTLTAKVLSAKPSGKDTISTVEIQFAAEVDPGDGKLHKVSGKARYQEVWTRVGGAWKIRSQTTLSQNMKVD